MSWQPPADAGRTLIPGLQGYTDLQLIAHGSTAMVFRATQSRLNRTVAIKVLLIDDVMTTQANVARELETTVALSSQPHIVSIIDTGVIDDGSPYIVMEYCEGGSYAQILKRRGPLPLDEVLEVGVKIGEALHAAHGVGIVHRDVKPPNILRSKFGPALADFGIARAADDGGAATSTLDKLTPHHASPEALLRGAQSGPSDLYSLASTMWNLLAGRPPFHDTTLPRQDPLAFRLRVLNQPMPRVPRDDIPEWLHAELARAMAKDPGERHESAAAFADVLRDQSARQRASSPWAPQTAQDTALMAPPDAPIPRQASAPPLSAPPAPGEQPASGSAGGPEVAPVDGDALTQWVRSPVSAPWPEPAPPSPEPPDPDGADGPPSRARAVLVMSLIGVLFGVLIVAANAVLGGGDPKPGPTVAAKNSSAPAAEPTATPPPGLASPAAGVTGLAIEDHRSSVRLTWTNGGSAAAPKMVVGNPALPGQQRRPMGDVPAGATSAVVNGLNSELDYCFVVIAVHSADSYASSVEVCTKRVTGSTPPS